MLLGTKMYRHFKHPYQLHTLRKSLKIWSKLRGNAKQLFLIIVRRCFVVVFIWIFLRIASVFRFYFYFLAHHYSPDLFNYASVIRFSVSIEIFIWFRIYFHLSSFVNYFYVHFLFVIFVYYSFDILWIVNLQLDIFLWNQISYIHIWT